MQIGNRSVAEDLLSSVLLFITTSLWPVGIFLRSEYDSVPWWAYEGLMKEGFVFWLLASLLIAGVLGPFVALKIVLINYVIGTLVESS